VSPVDLPKLKEIGAPVVEQSQGGSGFSARARGPALLSLCRRGRKGFPKRSDKSLKRFFGELTNHSNVFSPTSQTGPNDRSIERSFVWPFLGGMQHQLAPAPEKRLFDRSIVWAALTGCVGSQNRSFKQSFGVAREV
jgi:hypothetical protein